MTKPPSFRVQEPVDTALLATSQVLLGPGLRTILLLRSTAGV
jgi:hypothetical protein